MLGRTNTGGGGGGLNVQVVGGTATPSNPKENTIWFDTDVKITTWAFSATAPEAPVEGVAWIVTGNASPAEFNALKKHSIVVYPVSGKQYISGVWVDKPCQIYQGGEWSAFWDGYYFENGNQYENITGGWTTQEYKNDTSAQVTVDKTLTVSAPQSNNATIGTANKIDLEDVDTLYVECTEKGAYSVYLTVSETKTVSTSGGYIARVAIDVGVNALEVHTLHGEYYIAITGKGGSSGSAKGVIRAIWKG